MLDRSLAFSITPSLPPSLPPGGCGGAGEAAKRSGPALEECGSAEGAEPDAVSPRFEKPEPRRPNLAGSHLAPEQQVIGAGKAGRAGTRTRGETGTRIVSQTDRHASAHWGMETQRETGILAEIKTANKRISPDQNGIERGSKGVGNEPGTCGDQMGIADEGNTS